MGCNPPTQSRCKTCKHALIESLAIVKRNEKMRRALQEYITLLEAELVETVPLANMMCWISKRFKAGEAMREKITQLEEKL